MKIEFHNKYELERNNMVVSLIESGGTVQEIAKIIGVRYQRIEQIYFRATGKHVAEFRLELKLKIAKENLPRLLESRKVICKGCKTIFISNPRRKFHNGECREMYHALHQKEKPSYKKNHIK